MKFVLQVGIVTMMIGKLGYHLVLKINQMDMLARAPDRRFQSIDAKLSHALRKVIDNAGDKSMQMKYDMSMKNQLYGKSGDIIKGRELFAMILVKSPDHTEVLYSSHHLYLFNYYGDDQLEAFYNKWLDIVYNMKQDDRPSLNSLRDTLVPQD